MDITKNLKDRFSNVISKTNQDIGKVGIFLIINGLLALVQHIVTVQIFGVSRGIEIYFAAMVSMTTIDRLFNIGTINEILIPNYIRLNENENQDVAMVSFSLINNWLFLVTLIAAFGLWFAAPFFLEIILPGFNQQEIQQTTALFRALVLFIPLRMFNGMCSIPFRANKIYTVHERTGMVNKLILIVLLLFLTDTYGVKLLVFGAILGIIIRFFYILYLFKKHGYQYKFLLKSDRFSMKWILNQVYIPFLQSVGLQINRWIVLAAFTFMPQGLFAIYKYVQQFYLNFYPIIMKPVGMVFLTETSNETKLYNRDLISAYLSKASLISFFSLTIAVCAGKEFLQVIWGSSKFSPENISFAYVLFVFSFSTMLLSMTENIYQKSNIARGNIARQFIGSLVILILSSVVFLLTVKALGFYAIILHGLLEGIAQLFYSIYVNYFLNKASFVIFKRDYLLKALVHSLFVILIVYMSFELIPFDFVLSRPSLFGLMLTKTLVATLIFLAVNKYLKVYRLRYILNT